MLIDITILVTTMIMGPDNRVRFSSSGIADPDNEPMFMLDNYPIHWSVMGVRGISFHFYRGRNHVVVTEDFVEAKIYKSTYGIETPDHWYVYFGSVMIRGDVLAGFEEFGPDVLFKIRS